MCRVDKGSTCIIVSLPASLSLTCLLFCCLLALIIQLHASYFISISAAKQASLVGTIELNEVILQCTHPKWPKRHCGESVTVSKRSKRGNITNHTDTPWYQTSALFSPGLLSFSFFFSFFMLSLCEFWSDLTHMFSITSFWPTLSVWYFLHLSFPPFIYFSFFFV